MNMHLVFPLVNDDVIITRLETDIHNQLSFVVFFSFLLLSLSLFRRSLKGVEDTLSEDEVSMC